MRLSNLGMVALLLIGGAALAQDAIPLGNQLQINTYTTGAQQEPAVAADPLGGFVVVWHSIGSADTDTSAKSIQARRYDADGVADGAQFQVNSYTTDLQHFPAILAASQGDFVVFWTSSGSYGSDNSGGSIQAQRFDSNGSPIGEEQQINSYTTSFQARPAVAADGSGNFVVAWQSYGSYGTDVNLSVQAQRFEADGTPVGGQFQVNSYTTGYQRTAGVAVDNLGNFVVVWESYGSYGTDTSSFSVQAQRFDPDGDPIGGQFQVNTYTTGRQMTPAVAGDAQGNFVVVWESEGSFGSDTNYSIQARRYDSSGTPLGGEFQANSYTTNAQKEPTVAIDEHGNFMVVWDSPGSDGTDFSLESIQAQRYYASGVPMGEQFQVNSYITSTQTNPAAVVLDHQGTFVIVWDSEGSHSNDVSDESVHAQRFEGFILIDGFETGDTSYWSNTLP